MSVSILTVTLALWGVVHSILASYFVKDRLSNLGFPMNYYRLAYNVFALLSFLPVLYLMSVLPNKMVYQIPAPWKWAMFGGQGLAIILLLASFLSTDSLSFIGIRQLFEKEALGELVTRGLYRYVRHPLYTFSLLFIWLSPAASQNSLTVYIGATIYTMIGAYFEEKKLLRDFGRQYEEYKKITPMLIPGLILKR